MSDTDECIGNCDSVANKKAFAWQGAALRTLLVLSDLKPHRAICLELRNARPDRDRNRNGKERRSELLGFSKEDIFIRGTYNRNLPGEPSCSCNCGISRTILR